MTASRKIIIFGTGGHARKVYQAASLSGWQVLGFYDENEAAISPVDNLTVLNMKQLQDVGPIDFVVAIGDKEARARLLNEFTAYNWRAATVIHPDAYVASDAKLGAGTVVLANAIIETKAQCGVGCIVDIGVLVDHDTLVGKWCHLRPGSIIEPYTWLREGTIIQCGEVVPTCKR